MTINNLNTQKILDDNFELACTQLDIIPSIPTLGAIPLVYRQQVLNYYKHLVIQDAINNTPRE